MDTATTRASHTVDQILDRYERDSMPRLAPRTRKDYARVFPLLREQLGERIAAHLTVSDILNFRSKIPGKVQPFRVVSVLSSALSEAVEWRWLDGNPCKQITRPEFTRDKRDLSNEELSEWKQLAPPRLRLALELVLHTGQQQVDILNLKWAHVRDKERVILFRPRKAKQRVRVPITRPLRTVLQECRGLHESSEFVLPTEEGGGYTSEGFRSVWQRFMKKWKDAGNDGFDFHDLREKARDQAVSAERSITFIPSVFEIPTEGIDADLVAVMMPFSAEFDGVYRTILEACKDCGLRAARASDIWEHSTIIQDIFNLLYKAQAVVVDFSGKNPNVMYETGIAHTLGKLVIPISQSLDDVPFDIKHHRVLKYHSNAEGLSDLKARISARLRFITS